MPNVSEVAKKGKDASKNSSPFFPTGARANLQDAPPLSMNMFSRFCTFECVRWGDRTCPEDVKTGTCSPQLSKPWCELSTVGSKNPIETNLIQITSSQKMWGKKRGGKGMGAHPHGQGSLQTRQTCKCRQQVAQGGARRYRVRRAPSTCPVCL